MGALSHVLYVQCMCTQCMLLLILAADNLDVGWYQAIASFVLVQGHRLCACIAWCFVAILTRLEKQKLWFYYDFNHLKDSLLSIVILCWEEIGSTELLIALCFILPLKNSYVRLIKSSWIFWITLEGYKTIIVILFFFFGASIPHSSICLSLFPLTFCLFNHRSVFWKWHLPGYCG